MSEKLEEIKTQKKRVVFKDTEHLPNSFSMLIHDVADLVYELIEGHPDNSLAFRYALEAGELCRQCQDLIDQFNHSRETRSY